jgi:hypothetical protein
MLHMKLQHAKQNITLIIFVSYQFMQLLVYSLCIETLYLKTPF